MENLRLNIFKNGGVVYILEPPRGVIISEQDVQTVRDRFQEGLKSGFVVVPPLWTLTINIGG